MEFLADLWLPILLSSVFVFVTSSVFHMAIPFHKAEYRRLPDEEGILAFLGEKGLTRGDYWFPISDMKELKDPAVVARYDRGPVGAMTIMDNGVPNMPRSLLHWFVFSVIVSVFCAYIATFALGNGADTMAAFRLTGTVAALAYGVSHVPDSIWKGKLWSTTFKYVFEGLVYGLVTAGTFGWLWPTAA